MCMYIYVYVIKYIHDICEILFPQGIKNIVELKELVETTFSQGLLCVAVYFISDEHNWNLATKTGQILISCFMTN